MKQQKNVDGFLKTWEYEKTIGKAFLHFLLTLLTFCSIPRFLVGFSCGGHGNLEQERSKQTKPIEAIIRGRPASTNSDCSVLFSSPDFFGLCKLENVYVCVDFIYFSAENKQKIEISKHPELSKVSFTWNTSRELSSCRKKAEVVEDFLMFVSGFPNLMPIILNGRWKAKFHQTGHTYQNNELIAPKETSFWPKLKAEKQLGGKIFAIACGEELSRKSILRLYFSGVAKKGQCSTYNTFVLWHRY